MSDLTEDEAKLLAAITEKEADFRTAYRSLGMTEQVANVAFIGLAAKGLANGGVFEHISSRTVKIDKYLIKTIHKL